MSPRGRPKGVRNGEGKALAPIKKWTPKHDMIVNLHLAMKSHKEISAIIGDTEQRVCQVLKDPTARKLIERFRERVLEQVSESIEEELVVVAKKALKNVHETIGIEGLVHGTDFKKHQDRLSFDVLKGVGFLPGDREGQGDKTPSLSESLSKKLVAALERSNELEEEKREEREIEVGEDVEFSFVVDEDD